MIDTWPDVLRLLVLIVGAVASLAASLAGLAWTVGRIFRPWMRNEVREGNEVLYGRLKGNDFKHVEDRIGEGLAGVNQRLDGIDSRLNRMDDRSAKMEARILAAVRETRQSASRFTREALRAEVARARARRKKATSIRDDLG